MMVCAQCFGSAIWYRRFVNVNDPADQTADGIENHKRAYCGECEIDVDVITDIEAERKNQIEEAEWRWEAGMER